MTFECPGIDLPIANWLRFSHQEVLSGETPSRSHRSICRSRSRRRRPRRLAERTLEVVMSLSNGRSGAVFTHQDGKVTLFASRGIDQHVLDAIQTVWNRFRESFVAERRSTRPTSPRTAASKPASAEVPPARPWCPCSRATSWWRCCMSTAWIPTSAPRRTWSGWASSRASSPRRSWTRALRAARGAVGGLGDLPRAHADRGHGAREAAAAAEPQRDGTSHACHASMGVTRRTIYLRLQRYNIPRERVPKTRPPYGSRLGATVLSSSSRVHAQLRAWTRLPCPPARLC